MSYSISAKGVNKAAAKEAVAAQFDSQVVAHQPIHARDRAAVLANINSAIDLLADNDEKDVYVSANGSVMWNGDGENTADAPLGQVSINCSVGHTVRMATPGQ